MLRHMQLRFWLRVMDVCQLCGGFGGRVYLYAVERASGCVDWGQR